MIYNNSNALASQVEAIITTKHLDIKHETIHTSTQWAISNRPNVEVKTIESFIDPIYSRYSSLNLEIQSLLQPDLHITLGSVEMENSTKQIVVLKQNLAQLENENAKQRSTYQGKTFFWPILAFLFCITLIAILTYGEWTYIVSALLIITQNQDKAFWLAITISSSVILLAHLVPPLVRAYVKSIFLRRIVYLLLLALIWSTFLTLGFLRSKYLRIMQNIDTSPFLFVMITVLIFIGIFLVIDRFLIPILPYVRDAFRVLRAWYTGIRNRIKIKEYKKEIKQIEETTTDKLMDRITLISKAKSAEAKINSLYLECCSAAKEANLHHRTDNQIPACFNQPVPMLKSLTENINI